MERKNRKVEQLRIKYDQLKKKIRDWETAIFKTENRKPGKDDMKAAPSNVQESYRDLVKIRKYLEEISSRPAGAKNETCLTPGKLFLARNKRKLQWNNGFSDHCPNTERKKKSPDSADPPFKKLFSSLRLSENDLGAGKKRPASTAFAGSPEKPEQERKFFKSLKGDRITLSPSPKKPSEVPAAETLLTEEKYSPKSPSWRSPRKQKQPRKIFKSLYGDRSLLVSSPEKSEITLEPFAEGATALISQHSTQSELDMVDTDMDHFSEAPETISHIIEKLTDETLGLETLAEGNDTSMSFTPEEQNNSISTTSESRIIFSPSPEKPQPRKKFFKSPRSRATRAVFTRSSAFTYKPPSPLKKVSEKSKEAEKKKSKPTVVKKKPIQDKPENDNSEDNATTTITTHAAKNQVIDVFDEVSQAATTTKKKRGRRFNAKNQTLDSKMASGKVEDNYVRIDTTKKVFVRGHKKISVSKLKRLDYKHRKSLQGKGPAKLKTFTCNKCGETGHFARFCPQGTVSTNQSEDAPGEIDDSPFPTLEEAAKGNTALNFSIGSSLVNTRPLVEVVEPFFNSQDDDTSPEETVSCSELEENILNEGIRAFGFDDFRPGQKETISRVLKGLSTLLILSTGSGKSLCYQLPAYLYQKKYPGAMTICISPLVSLMEDQVQGIAPFLNAACLHSGMTSKQKDVVLEKIKSKKLHILLVSPEAVCGGLFGLFSSANDSLPKISFACIDEVHCVSQWSHNFRPSYLQLCKILREKFGVKTILGLTATATETTARSICEHLNIDPSTTIRGELIPKNLKLSVSRDVHKDEALLNLLRGERFRDCDSIIIYCTRREECERIATLVRTKMQELSTNKIIKTKSGGRLSGNCEAYHAGMTPRKRKNVQNGFMSGDIRIVVATVAFGMGIDKSDIRAVIHYNMPSAFESYVQEIGRAGRDGLPAHCHLFLDNSRRNDLCELKRHVYANSVDRPTIRKLLRKVFQPCKCKDIEKLRGNNSEPVNGNCPGHEVSFSMDDIVLELDLPKENITTLLCYLELGEKKWIEILPLTYEICKIHSYGGAHLLKSAASRCPPLAVAIALQKEKNKFRDTDTYLEFNVIEAAATVGWNSGVVKKELKNLEWVGSQFDEKGNPTRFRKAGLLVEFSGLAYRVKSPGSLDDEVADEILNSLHGRNVRQEQTELYQLQRVYQALLSVSFANVNNLCDSYDEEKSNQLKAFIYDYFSESNETIQTGTEAVHSLDAPLEAGKEEQLRRSIQQLIDSNRDLNFTTRSIARIFQGISSPCYPADVWYRNKDFWRRFLDIDFHVICRIAAEEL